MGVAQEEFWYLDMAKLALLSPLQAPMTLAQGLVPALLGPMGVAQEEFWYLDIAKLALLSPKQAPIAVAQGPVPALLALLAPMWVAQEEFWYLDRVKLAPKSTLQAPLQWPRGWCSTHTRLWVWNPWSLLSDPHLYFVNFQIIQVQFLWSLAPPSDPRIVSSWPHWPK